MLKNIHNAQKSAMAAEVAAALIILINRKFKL